MKDSGQTGKWVGRLPTVRPSLFTIPLGLGGLSTCWQLASVVSPTIRTWIGGITYWPAFAIFAFLLFLWAIRIAAHPKGFIEDVKDSITGSLNSLIPLAGMIIAGGLYSFEPSAAVVLFIVMFCWTLGLGALWTWYWIQRSSSTTQNYPSHYLHFAGGGFIGSITSARLGFGTLAIVSFCIGFIFWLPIGSVALRSLVSAPTIPRDLIPTLAIEISVPALAGRAYFAVTDYRIDIISVVFATYTILLLLIQIRFLPFYRTVKFSLGYWSFAFPLSTISAYCIEWLNQIKPAGNLFFELLVLGLITLLVAAIAYRSLIFLISHR